MTELDANGVRQGSTRRRKRAHPALGARILSTGISATAMFGIVAALGAGNAPAAETTPSLMDPAGASTIVVVDPALMAPREVTLSEVSNQPVQLTATPVVRAAQPAAAPARATPVARTNGSR